MAPRVNPASAAISSMEAPFTPFLAKTTSAASRRASRVSCRRRSGVSFSGTVCIMTEFTVDFWIHDRILHTMMYHKYEPVREERVQEVRRWVQRQLGYEAWLDGLRGRPSDSRSSSSSVPTSSS